MEREEIGGGVSSSREERRVNDMACSTRQVREGRGGGPEGERQGFLLACKKRATRRRSRDDPRKGGRTNVSTPNPSAPPPTPPPL